MKTKAALLLALLALVCAVPRSAEGRVEVSFDFFYDSLSPHGEWIEVGDYGPCWRPHHIDADWRPYSDGYWSYTDGGWTWVSYEDYGGIVYHYGRWVEVDDEGWCWVPDYEWAPAWVSWRSNDDYIGWAPLPPEARWRRETGFSVWVDAHYDIGPSHFNFCRTRDFGAPYLRPVIVNRHENTTIIVRTANVTNITYYDDHDFGGIVHCGGPSFTFINQHVHRPIPTLKLVHKTNITNINVKNVNIFNAEPRGNQLAVLNPRVIAPAKGLGTPKLVRSIPAAKVSKGWAGVKDPDAAEAIRTRMRQESRGLTPESAPARRVQAADLKEVPKKADPNAPSTVRTAKKPAGIATQKPDADKSKDDKPKDDQPADPRTAERMLRERGRGPSDDKPLGIEKPGEREPAKKIKPDTAQPDARRQATRAIPPAVTAPTVAEKKKETPERKPIAKPRDTSDDEAKARAAAAARERAAAEQKSRAAADQKARAATLERMRATEEATQRQKAQSEAAREMQRRQVVEQPRREPAQEIKRMKPSDDSAQKAAAQAAARQRQMESARQQQAESARRAQMDSARKEQAMQAARQQQQQQQAAARQQMQRQIPPAAPGSSGKSEGRKELSKEELEALKKGRGR
jgi:hypothetical protein